VSHLFKTRVELILTIVPGELVISAVSAGPHDRILDPVNNFSNPRRNVCKMADCVYLGSALAMERHGETSILIIVIHHLSYVYNIGLAVIGQGTPFRPVSPISMYL
jgi:hypothetical protein